MSFTVPRGSHKTFEIALTDYAGAAIDLTGYALYYTVKAKLSDEEPTFRKRNTVAGGGDAEIELLPQSGATLGKVRLKLVPADTEDLPLDGYLGDLWIVSPVGERTPALEPQAFDIGARVSSDFSA